MAKLIECGVDWLRVTTAETRCQSELSKMWEQLCQEQLGSGGIITEASRLGYTGTSVNGCFFGSRADGAMLDLPGHIASEWWPAVLGTSANVTRLDLQCTIQTDEYEVDYGGTMAQYAMQARAHLEGRNWAAVRHLQAFGKGDTVTVGSRTSEKYGRIYDKEK